MAIERTNVSQFSLIPEGKYDFTVKAVPEKKKSDKGGFYWIFKLAYICGGQEKTSKVLFFPSSMGDLLLAIGGKPVEDDIESIDWDPDAVVGKMFSANVLHEEGKNGKKREKFDDVQPVQLAWDS